MAWEVRKVIPENGESDPPGGILLIPSTSNYYYLYGTAANRKIRNFSEVTDEALIVFNSVYVAPL